MDSALLLRKAVDSGQPPGNAEVLALLQASPLVDRLKRPCKTVLASIWRLIALGEIPGANALESTQRLVSSVLDNTFTGIGFSLTGKQTDIVPCYNAMISKALLRLTGNTRESEAGIRWILENQPFARDTPSPWKGIGITKFGGCMKATPCYIGVVKSLAALLEYERLVGTDSLLRQRIKEGRNYVVSHDLVFRKRDGEPITKHILGISFPESYQLNLVDVVQTLDASSAEHLRHSKALDYLLSKRSPEGQWQVDYLYRADGYLTFDRRGKPGKWVSHILERQMKELRPDSPSVAAPSVSSTTGKA